MAEEPVPGQTGDGLEGTRLLEQVVGAGHHGQLTLATQLGLGPAVEVQYHLVAPADDQQRRRGHRRKPGPGQIRAACFGISNGLPAGFCPPTRFLQGFAC